MATHSSILARRIPWTEEPGRPQSTGLQRVGHDLVTSLSLSPLNLNGTIKKEIVWYMMAQMVRNLPAMQETQV